MTYDAIPGTAAPATMFRGRTADITGDGAVGIADQSAMTFAHRASIGHSDYNVDADISRTGTVNNQDLEWTTTQNFQAALPKGRLSAHGNSIGYAGACAT